MNLVDQFIASISFSSQKVQGFRKQSAWKSITYVLILVLLSNLLTAGYALFKGTQNNLYDQVKQLSDFTIDKNGLTYNDSPKIISLPQFDTIILFGSNDADHISAQGMKNIITFGKEDWTVGRTGFPGTKQSYDTLLSFIKKNDTTLTKAETLAWTKTISDNLNYFAPLYQYTAAVIDLVTQLGLISLLALAGLSYRRFVKITYKEAWTITAYGISAPVLAKTFLSLLGFQMSFIFLLYWAAVGFFAIRTIRAIEPEKPEYTSKHLSA